MSVEVIPSGSSIVVTQENKDWAKDAERVKDVLATMASTAALQFANVERSAAEHTENVIQDVKDAEARLSQNMSNHFENVIQDVKDAEVRLTKDAGDKFIQTIQDIKNAARDTALASGHTNELVQRDELNTSKEAAFTREYLAREVNRTRESMDIQFKEAEKVAFQNQLQTALAFKDQALLSEKLAAKQELLSEKLYAQSAREAAEHTCELRRDIAGVKEAMKQQEIDRLREQLIDAKILGRRIKTFSPVPAGTLQADED